MQLEIAGHAGGKGTTGVLEREVLRDPTGFGLAHGACQLQRVEEGVADERVVGLRVWVGAGIPSVRIELRDARRDSDDGRGLLLELAHRRGSIPVSELPLRARNLRKSERPPTAPPFRGPSECVPSR